MAYSYSEHPSVGVGQTLPLGFLYEPTSTVRVLVDGVLVPESLYFWSSNTEITTLTGFPTGAVTKVERFTPIDEYNAQNGTSVYDFEGVNLNFQQLLYALQESRDNENSRQQQIDNIGDTAEALALGLAQVDQIKSDVEDLAQAAADSAAAAETFNPANFYTKTQADARYYTQSQVYTKTEADGRYYTQTQVYTKTEADGRYYTQAATPIPMAKSPPRLVWVNGTTVTVKADKCRDELDAVNLVFPSDINVVLAGAPTTAHRHVLVGYDGTGTPAAVFSTTDALPGGWQAYRRVGSIRTDGVGAIYQFIQVGDRVEYNVPINVLSYNNNAPSTVQLTALLVPVGMPVVALLTCQVIQSGGGSGLDVWCPDHGTGRSVTNGAAGMTTATAAAGAVASNASTTSGVIAPVDVLTNASGQVNIRSATAGATVNVQVRGYVDRRGRDK